MAKIRVKPPLVELDGDEMTCIIWAKIRERLILYDLSGFPYTSSRDCSTAFRTRAA
jgi:isocitrate dehydrogenase